MNTFTWIPDKTVSLTHNKKTLVSQFENGTKKWYKKGNRPRKWELNFTNRDYGVIMDIVDFWDSVDGAGDPFSITLYNGITGADETVTVHFVGDEIHPKTIGYYAGSLSLTIEEVL